MAEPSCNTKIVLMSATLQVEKFKNYFKLPRPDGHDFFPPVIDLSAVPRSFPVDEFYLDHFERFLMGESLHNLIDYNEPEITSGMFVFGAKILAF